MGGSIHILGGCHCHDFSVDGPFEGLLLLLLGSITIIIHAVNGSINMDAMVNWFFCKQTAIALIRMQYLRF